MSLSKKSGESSDEKPSRKASENGDGNDFDCDYEIDTTYNGDKTMVNAVKRYRVPESDFDLNQIDPTMPGKNFDQISIHHSSSNVNISAAHKGPNSISPIDYNGKRKNIEVEKTDNVILSINKTRRQLDDENVEAFRTRLIKEFDYLLPILINIYKIQLTGCPPPLNFKPKAIWAKKYLLWILDMFFK